MGRADNNQARGKSNKKKTKTTNNLKMVLTDQVSIEFLEESFVQNPTPTQALSIYLEPQSITKA